MKTVSRIGFLICVSLCCPLAAQDSPLKSTDEAYLRPFDDSVKQSTSSEIGLGNAKRWMLICCGLPGDEIHREKLTTAVRQLAGSSESVFEVDSERLQILAGDEEMANSLKDSGVNAGVCTRDEMTASLLLLSKKIHANDSLWVILLGHAQLYAGRSTFNVKGRDFDAVELSRWLEPVQCRERVLMLTMPVSGFWIKPLRGPRTVVISATDTDFEFTGTEMPYALASVVSGNSEQALEDRDQDGRISLLDLYVATSLEVHAKFKSLERLQTEHAQIDDNGDGVGHELHQPYLPVDSAEGESPAKPVPVKRTTTVNSDGDLASTIKLVQPKVASVKSTNE